MSIRSFLTKYLSMESIIHRLGMQMKQPAKWRCTIICRKSSLVMSAWFKKRRLVGGPIAGPNLERFFEDVEMDNNWEQVVPQAVLMQLGLQSGTTNTDVSTPAGGGAGAGSGSHTPGGGSSGGTSGGGTPSGGPPGGGRGDSSSSNLGQRINNVNFVSSLFQQFRDMTTITCK